MEEVKFVRDNEILEHAFIARGRFRNFSGVKTDVNKTGRRLFTVFLPYEVAMELGDIGWPIKEMAPYREGDDPTYKLEIEASWDTKGGQFHPPIIKMTSWDGVETELNEQTVGMLDRADIVDAKVEIRPYNWDVNGKKGCKAYLVELDVKLKKPRRTLNANLNRYNDDEGEEDEL